MNSLIDLRSDTVTRPSAAMRQAMANAEVDDDVVGVDPTVGRLQERIADELGKEAALFMPSGTMTNQVAVRLHCKPGDEFLCEAGCHIFHYEQGAYAQLSGVAIQTVAGTNGVLEVDQLRHLVRPDDEHAVRTKLVCIENTHNRAAGAVQPIESVAAVCAWAKEQGLRRHLDGARLFNAVAATGISAKEWAGHFDTVSVCFSKGLGAPVGSALVGTREAMAEARRHRKLFGGGMRQSGIIAAGALYALDHNVERLADDHRNAQVLAAAIADTSGLELATERVDTNIVYFRVDESIGPAAELARALQEEGVHVLALGHEQIRAVTHLDVSEEEMHEAARILKRVAAGRSK